MLIASIENATVTIGRDQGFLGLPLRVEPWHCPVSGDTIALTSAWSPTPEELAALNAGASVHVRLINVTRHPPIMLEVGPVPGDAPGPLPAEGAA